MFFPWITLVGLGVRIQHCDVFTLYCIYNVQCLCCSIWNIRVFNGLRPSAHFLKELTARKAFPGPGCATRQVQPRQSSAHFLERTDSTKGFSWPWMCNQTSPTKTVIYPEKPKQHCVIVVKASLDLMEQEHRLPFETVVPPLVFELYQPQAHPSSWLYTHIHLNLGEDPRRVQYPMKFGKRQTPNIRLETLPAQISVLDLAFLEVPDFDCCHCKVERVGAMMMMWRVGLAVISSKDGLLLYECCGVQETLRWPQCLRLEENRTECTLLQWRPFWKILNARNYSTLLFFGCFGLFWIFWVVWGFFQCHSKNDRLMGSWDLVCFLDWRATGMSCSACDREQQGEGPLPCCFGLFQIGTMEYR